MNIQEMENSRKLMKIEQEKMQAKKNKNLILGKKIKPKKILQKQNLGKKILGQKKLEKKTWKTKNKGEKNF